MKRYYFLIVALACVVGVGCAQNTEPQGLVTQRNSGPLTPQHQTINNFFVAGDYNGGVTTCPAGEVFGEDADKDKPMWARGNPGTGLASSQGPARGRIHNLSVWQDAGTSASPRVGAMSPAANQTQRVDANQEPQTQVNPAVALAAPGGAASAAANGTAGFGAGATTGGATTATPTQTPVYTAVKASAGTLGGILEALGAYIQGLSGFIGSPATQPGG